MCVLTSSAVVDDAFIWSIFTFFMIKFAPPCMSTGTYFRLTLQKCKTKNLRFPLSTTCASCFPRKWTRIKMEWSPLRNSWRHAKRLEVWSLPDTHAANTVILIWSVICSNPGWKHHALHALVWQYHLNADGWQMRKTLPLLGALLRFLFLQQYEEGGKFTPPPRN